MKKIQNETIWLLKSCTFVYELAQCSVNDGDSGIVLPAKNELNSTSDLFGCVNGASWAAPLMVAKDKILPYTCVHPATCKSEMWKTK